MDTDRLLALVSSLARALQSEQRQAAIAAGLVPVQWHILCYLRTANRYSNTPQAIADYLTLTKGTVSQSLKLLEARAWITRSSDPIDRRVVRLTLTDAGLRRLGSEAAAAEREWFEAAAHLPAKQREAAENVLARLLGEWQQVRHGRTFGVCRSCRHFNPGSPAHRCGLTGEALSDADSALICREHAPAGPP